MSRTPPPAPNTISRPSDGGDIEASVPEPPGNMQDKYVLFQGIPQEAYGRMKVLS